MNTKVRLLRKPFTTALWLTLVTVMTVLLCVGGALWYSSESAAKIIDELHSTLAYRTDLQYTVTDQENGRTWSFQPRTTSPEGQKLLKELDCVEAIYDHTLTGGYSPSFTPLISHGAFYEADESYDSVLLAATVTDIREEYRDEDAYDLTAVGLGGVETHISLAVTVTVDEYLAVNEELCLIGTQWDTDEWLVYVECLKESDAEFLEVGGRYMFCGEYNRYGMEDTPTLFLYGTGFRDGNALRGVTNMSYQSDIGEEVELPRIITADVGEPFAARLEGTVEEFLADPANAEWLSIVQSRKMAQHSLPILGTESLESMYIFANNKVRIDEGRMFTPEEYASGARVCILSAALAEKSGIKLGDTVPISQFWCGAQSLEDDSNHSTHIFATDGMLNNPTVGHIDSNTFCVTRDEEFTVVGLYILSSDWGNSSYAVTSNTVFIPKGAQIPGGFGGFNHVGTVTYLDEYGEEVTASRASPEASWGIYQTIRLKNGTAEEFKAAIAGTELEGEFIITDQGYGAILGSVRSISESARGLLALVLGGWALLLVLYLLLYQGKQRRNIGIMRSLGAAPKEAQGYLWGSGMAVAALGVLIGSAVSAGIMDIVQELLFEASTYTVALSRYSASGPSEQSFRQLLERSALPLWAIAALAAAQLAVFALTMYIQSRSLSNQEPRHLLGK